MAFSCSKSGEDTVPPRDFDEQYIADKASLQTFFDEYHMDVDANYNVAISKPTTGQQSIRQQYTLNDTTVKYNDKDYHLYFIKFNKGDDEHGRRPTQVDSVYVSYKAMGLNGVQFDGADNPVWFRIPDLISGWAHILPSFYTGTYSSASPADPPVHSNYGAGVMFLPSGFAYFSSAVGDLGAYSPMIFSFKLLELRYRDQDGDGILSKDESTMSDVVPGSFPPFRWINNPYNYDSDGDGIPNMYDVDDDNDRYSTKHERRNYPDRVNHPNDFTVYPFESIPDCSGNTTDLNRKKRHLDATCHGSN